MILKVYHLCIYTRFIQLLFQVVSDLDIDEKYRNLHRNKNPSYEQFIVGEGIAIFIVRIEKARICDVHDKVTYWEANKITI